MQLSPSLEVTSRSATEEFQNTEHEGSLMCSQDPTTGSSPQPD
jgi:hypothetical protein